MKHRYGPILIADVVSTKADATFVAMCLLLTLKELDAANRQEVSVMDTLSGCTSSWNELVFLDDRIFQPRPGVYKRSPLFSNGLYRAWIASHLLPGKKFRD